MKLFTLLTFHILSEAVSPIILKLKSYPLPALCPTKMRLENCGEVKHKTTQQTLTPSWQV